MLAMLLALVACTRSAAAQGRGQTTPLGGRSALLGGTGVAAGADAAVPLLNPAGILAVDAGLLSFSTRFIRFGVREYEQFRSVGSDDPNEPDVNDVTFAALPAGTCYFGRVMAGAKTDPTRRQHKLSFCIYQSERDTTFAEGGLISTQAGDLRRDSSTTVASEWKRNHFGVGWATPLGNEVAIGLSSFLVSTSLERFDVAAAIDNRGAGGNSTYLHNFSGTNFQLVNALGITIKAGRYFTSGLSVRAPGLTLQSSAETTTSLSATGGAGLFEAGEGSFVSSVPARVALGMAYARGDIHLEANGFFTFPGPFARFVPDGQSIRIDGLGMQPRMALLREERARGRVNVAVGVEYHFSEMFTGLAGGSTNFSSLTPRVAEADNYLFLARRDGVSASVGTGISGTLGKILAGFRVEYLYGETLVPTTRGDHVLVDDDEWAVTAIVSGQIKVTETLRAARDLLTGK